MREIPTHYYEIRLGGNFSEYIFEQNDSYDKIRNFKEDCHYSFVEYQGSNITHLSFDGEEKGKIDVNSLCAQCFLIGDGDIEDKGTRKEDLKEALDDRFEILSCKEIENLIPEEVLQKLIEGKITNKEKINLIKYAEYSKPNEPIGKYLDSKLEVNKFAEASGTIKDKGNFCKKAVEIMSDSEFKWTLTSELKDLCKKVFDHILGCNGLM